MIKIKKPKKKALNSSFTYEDGFKDGLDQGSDQGFEKGWSKGIKVGYQVGWVEAYYNTSISQLEVMRNCLEEDQLEEKGRIDKAISDFKKIKKADLEKAEKGELDKK